MTEKSKNKKLLWLLLVLLLLCINLGFWGLHHSQSSSVLRVELSDTQSELKRSQQEILNLMLTLDSKSEEYAKLKTEFELLRQSEDDSSMELSVESALADMRNRLLEEEEYVSADLADEATGNDSSTTSSGPNTGEMIEIAEDASIIEEVETLPLPRKKILIFNGIELKKGEPINLDMQFANSSDRLTETSQLEALADFLKANAQVVIKLSGHTEPNPPTDSAVYKETADMHDRLSKRRVESVAIFLTNKGVNQAQIETAYFGGRQPKYSKNPKKNRRVEMELIKE